MTKIDFYVLPCDSREKRLQMVCRLAEKAVKAKQAVCIHCDDTQLIEQLDAALWAFRGDSFVAHSIIDKESTIAHADNDPVHLCVGQPAYDRRVLINLAPAVPAFFSRFERTLEVVNQDPEVRDSGRDRYRFYQQRGYPLQHHKITPSVA